MAQSEQFHEQWAHIRDTARPVVPDDVHFLREAREIMAPSRGHVKRIARPRMVIRVVPRNTPAPDTSARRHALEPINLGLQISRILRPNYHAPARPVDKPEPIAVEPVVIAGLLPNYHVAGPERIERLEPMRPIATRLVEVMARVQGPLTRKQQAEYAFTVAQYGDILYV